MGVLDILSIPLDIVNLEMNCFAWFDIISEFIEDISNFIFYFAIMAKGGDSGGMAATVLVTTLFESLSILLDVIKLYQKYMLQGAPKTEAVKKDKLMFGVAAQMIKFSIYEVPLLICATWANLEAQNIENELQLEISA